VTKFHVMKTGTAVVWMRIVGAFYGINISMNFMESRFDYVSWD